MKKQNFKKKLVLKKGIISNLNMSNVKGGYPAHYSDHASGCEWNPFCDIAK